MMGRQAHGCGTVASAYRRPGHRQGVFVANHRANGAEQRKSAPRSRCDAKGLCFVGVPLRYLNVCACFTAVYCTRTRGPVRNRTEPEVPLNCEGPVRPEPAGSFDCEGTRWIRTRGSVARCGTLWIFWVRLLHCDGRPAPPPAAPTSTHDVPN